MTSQTTNNAVSHKAAYTLLILAALACAAFVMWYTMPINDMPAPTPQASATPMANSGNTAADINADLDQIPDDSGLNGESTSLDTDIKGF